MTTRTDGTDWLHTPAPDDDLLDDWTPPRRTNRWTVVLAVAVVAGCTFTAGAIVQRQFGATTTAAATGARSGFARGQGFPTGVPSGGFPGFGGQTGQAGQGGQGGTTGGTGAPGRTGATASAGTAASGVPVVVGTVTSVKGSDLLVKNFADAVVTVHVPATATVTSPGLAGVAPGMTVSVVGTKASDGSVTATSVVARKAP